MTPLHVHGARTAAEYREIQRKVIARMRSERPALGWREPWLAPVDPPTPEAAAYWRVVFIGGGKWLTRCGCGNAPSVDPQEGLACCFECGAVFEGLTLPVAADEIERALVKRPMAHHRHWLPEETVEDLVRENRAKGVER